MPPHIRRLFKFAKSALAPPPRAAARRGPSPGLGIQPLEQRQMFSIEPLSTVQAAPQGWNIRTAQIDRQVSAADPNKFTVGLNVGQPIAVQLRAVDSATSFTLTSPTGAAVTSFTMQAGRTGMTTPYPVPIAGVWTITVANVGAGVGNYSLNVVLNAGLEGGDTSVASPRAIDNSLTTGDGPWRYAFVGSSSLTSGTDVDAYTVDLTSKVGQTIDVRLAGRNGVDLSGQTLQLIRPNGTVAATAVAGQGNIADASNSLLISNFVVPSAGVYTLRFTSQKAGNYGLVVSDGTLAGTISTQQLLSLMVSQGLTTKTSVSSLLSTLTFDRVFSSLTTDEVLNVLVRNGLSGSYPDLASYKTAIAGRGVNLTPFRPEGVLTALATAPGGSLLRASGAAIDAAAAWQILNNAFASNPTVFLDAFTNQRVIGFFDDSITSTSGAAVDKLTALATKTFASGYDDVFVAMYPLWVGNGEGNPTPQTALAATQQQPAGKRSMFLSDFTEILGYGSGVNPGRGYVDPVDSQGRPSSYYLVWMDQWAATTKAKITSFFTQYKALGGQLDNLILDIETTGLTYWDIQQFDRRIDQSTNQLPALTFWQSLQQDPRWPALKAQLLAAGIPEADLAIGSINSWDVHSDNAAKWNAVMEKRLNDYLNQAIYQPVAALFPNARVSNYSVGYRTQTQPAGDYTGINESYYSPGTVMGNRQSKELYGSNSYVTTPAGVAGPSIPFDARVKSIEFRQNKDNAGRLIANGMATITLFAPIQGLKAGDSITIENRGGQEWVDPQYTGQHTIYSVSADGLKIVYWMPLKSASSAPLGRDLSSRENVYSTAFVKFWDSYNTFVAEMKFVRTQTAASNVPLLPWISDETWQERFTGDVWTYYAETILQAGLSGAEDFLWWKYSWDPDAANTSVLGNAIRELNSLIGYADRQTITTTPVDWSDGYVLTGMEANGRRVYRLTPDPDQTVKLLSSTGNVKIQIGDKIVEIPNASIYTPASSVSNLGYWIVQTKGASSLAKSPSDVYAALQNLLRPQIAASDGVVGQPNSFTFTMNSQVFPSSTVFTFDVDWNGDGLFDSTYTGPSGTKVNAIYASARGYNVRVVASVLGAGEASPVGSKSITVAASAPTDNIRLVADSANPALMNLVYTGSSGNDRLWFSQPGPGTIQAWISTDGGALTPYTFTGVTGRVIAYGVAGNDVFDASLLTSPVAFYGGDGDDVFYGGAGNDQFFGGDGNNQIFADGGNDSIVGGAGNDLIVAGDGNDTVVGGGGRDVIFAGRGADRVTAGVSDALVVAGYSAFELDPLALAAIQAEWNSTRSLANRVANISGTGSGTRLNANYYLKLGTTVLDDGAVDIIYGGTGSLFGLLSATDSMANAPAGSIVQRPA